MDVAGVWREPRGDSRPLLQGEGGVLRRLVSLKDIEAFEHQDSERRLRSQLSALPSAGSVTSGRVPPFPSLQHWPDLTPASLAGGG